MEPQQPTPIRQESITELYKLSDEAKKIKTKDGCTVYNFSKEEVAKHFRDCLADCHIMGSEGKKYVGHHLKNNSDFGVVLTQKNKETMDGLFAQKVKKHDNFKLNVIDDYETAEYQLLEYMPKEYEDPKKYENIDRYLHAPIIPVKVRVPASFDKEKHNKFIQKFAGNPNIKFGEIRGRTNAIVSGLLIKYCDNQEGFIKAIKLHLKNDEDIQRAIDCSSIYFEPRSV